MGHYGKWILSVVFKLIIVENGKWISVTPVLDVYIASTGKKLKIHITPPKTPKKACWLEAF